MSDRDSQARTLYDRIGGAPVIASLVDDFYGRVLADPLLAPFFAETSVDRLRRMQREFFSAALDGPIEYSGLSLTEVHSGRGIQTRHFARFVEHLLSTLQAQGIDEQNVMDVISRINTYVTDITGEPGFAE